jgi:hypothetical protein
MKEFAKRDGNLVIQDAGPREIDAYGKNYDLVLVAAGKGEINRMFERDAEKSPYDRPMRALALTYVKNMVPRKPFDAVSFNLVPGVGEYFVFPALTTTGPCEIMVFEGVPGGPMDCWNDVRTPEEHLAKSKWILDTFMPLEGERCHNIELTDNNGILAGRFPRSFANQSANCPLAGWHSAWAMWLLPMIRSRVKVRIRRARRPASICRGLWSTATSRLMSSGCSRPLTTSGIRVFGSNGAENRFKT